MGITFCFNDPLPFFASKFVFSHDCNFDIRNFREQLFSGILERHAMSPPCVTGEDDEISHALGVERANNIFHERLQGGGRNGNGAGMA